MSRCKAEYQQNNCYLPSRYYTRSTFLLLSPSQKSTNFIRLFWYHAIGTKNHIQSHDSLVPGPAPHSQLFVPCAFPHEGHRTAFPMRQSPENWHPQTLLLSAGRTRGTFIIKGNRTRFPGQFNKIIENYLMQGVQWPISVWRVARGLWVHRHWLWKDVWLFPRKHRRERAELSHVCGMRDSEHGLGQGWIRDTVAIWPTMTTSCLGWFIAVIYLIQGKLVGNDPSPSGGIKCRSETTQTVSSWESLKF